MLRINLTLCLLATLLLVGCGNQGETDIGVKNAKYKDLRAELLILSPISGQFCLNGAAFELAGMREYSRQYLDDFGLCINVLMKRYQFKHKEEIVGLRK